MRSTTGPREFTIKPTLAIFACWFVSAATLILIGEKAYNDKLPSTFSNSTMPSNSTASGNDSFTSPENLAIYPYVAVLIVVSAIALIALKFAPTTKPISPASSSSRKDGCSVFSRCCGRKGSGYESQPLGVGGGRANYGAGDDVEMEGGNNRRSY